MEVLSTAGVWSFWFNIVLCALLTFAVFFAHLLYHMLAKEKASLKILERVYRSPLYQIGEQGAIAVPLCYLGIVLLVCGIWSTENKISFIEAVFEIAVEGSFFWVFISGGILSFALLYSLSALTCYFLKKVE